MLKNTEFCTVKGGFMVCELNLNKAVTYLKRINYWYKVDGSHRHSEMRKNP